MTKITIHINNEEKHDWDKDFRENIISAIEKYTNYNKNKHGAKMRKIIITIKGLSPLRHNRFIETSKSASGRAKTTDEQDIKEALTRSYRDEEGKFYLPKHAIKKTIIEGGKKVKVGRGGASNLLKAILFVDEEMNYLKTGEHKIMKDMVRVPPRTGARIMKMWVVNEDWECTIPLTLLDDTFPINALKESIESAGIYYGLLDGRPEFGRFNLEKFEVMKTK